MPMNMDLWKIKSNDISLLNKSKLESEERLENWIENDSSILGIDLLIIGRQVSTLYRGRIDLLGINSEGDLTIIELKKDKTPREVVAQVLDYASWIKSITFADIDRICLEYKGKSISEMFNSYFESSLPETLNNNHSMLIVASELDDSSERIIKYLTEEYKVNINTVFFNFFKDDNSEYLGRAWFLDQDDIQDKSDLRKFRTWSGYWFVNAGEGEGEHRTWEDNIKYSYIGAGQGTKYSRPLFHLKIGDHIFAYQRGLGYVGYGEVIKEAVQIKEFIDDNSGKYMIDLPMKAKNPKDNMNDPNLSEYAVGIKWIKTFSNENAKTYKGIFANQNIVCKLRNQQTTDFLMKEFVLKDSAIIAHSS